MTTEEIQQEAERITAELEDMIYADRIAAIAAIITGRERWREMAVELADAFQVFERKHSKGTEIISKFLTMKGEIK